MRTFIFLVAVVLCLGMHAEEYSVAKWKGNAKCAVSYTFDDGLRDQYELAFPVMKECGIRGTFWLIGSKIDSPSGMRSKAERNTPTMTWEMVNEMAKAGQEMSSHGLNHASCAKLDNDAIVREVVENKRLIAEKTGVTPVTFAYPYNAKVNRDRESIVELVESQGLVGSRRTQTSFGGGRGAKNAEAAIAKAKKSSGWVVFMTHGIARGYDHFADPEELYAHLRKTSQDGEIWIAPFREVCAYEKERNAVKLTIERLPDGKTRITPALDNLDKTLFDVPLTLIDSAGKPIRDFNPSAAPFVL